MPFIQNPAIPTPPTPPSPPTPPAPAQVVVQGPGGQVIEIARPMSAREVRALRARRSELSSQLSSASSRRNELARDLLRAGDGPNRAGIEERIALLDKRIIQIESDLGETGRLLASVPANLANTSATTEQSLPLGLGSDQITGISIVGIIFVLFPLALARARWIWKRSTRAAAAPASPESSQRLERLEQAVDAIAIEVERISEGQRFVTRLLTEGSAPALAVGQKPAEPVRLPEREALRASRESA